jgi:hypothetical protein
LSNTIHPQRTPQTTGRNHASPDVDGNRRHTALVSKPNIRPSPLAVVKKQKGSPRSQLRVHVRVPCPPSLAAIAKARGVRSRSGGGGWEGIVSTDQDLDMSRLQPATCQRRPTRWPPLASAAPKGRRRRKGRAHGWEDDFPTGRSHGFEPALANCSPTSQGRHRASCHGHRRIVLSWSPPPRQI